MWSELLRTARPSTHWQDVMPGTRTPTDTASFLFHQSSCRINGGVGNGGLKGPKGPHGAPWGPLGPLGPQIHCYGSWINSKPSQKINFLAFWSPKQGIKKLGFRPRDPHGEIRTGILSRIPVLKSQMVGWRPIWWRKGVIWDPVGFRAQPAHLNPPISNPPIYPA